MLVLEQRNRGWEARRLMTFPPFTQTALVLAMGLLTWGCAPSNESGGPDDDATHDDDTTPVADDDTTPIVDDDSTPVTDDDTTPIVDDDSTPVADDDTTPIVDDDSTPVVDDDTTPIVDDDSTPVTDDDTTPIVDDDSTPVVDDDTTPIVDDDSTPGEPAVCDDSVPPPADADGDGITADLDCNDADPSLTMGAVEDPGDGIDNDCDGVIDLDLCWEAVSPSTVGTIEIQPVLSGFAYIYPFTAGAGDVDGDGLSDVLLFEPQFSTTDLRATIMLGPMAEEDLSAEWGYATLTDVERAWSAWGDPTGDGNTDLLFAGSAGAVLLPGPIASGELTLAASGMPLISDAPEPLWHVGIGDVTGDGVADAIVRGSCDPVTYDSGSGGRVHVVAGPIPLMGVGLDLDSHSFAIFEGEAVEDCAGLSSAVGDFDGDGFPDLAVGAPHPPFLGSNSGQVYVVFGPLGPGTRSLATAGARLEAEDRGDQAGFAIATLPDRNGDGADEMLVGAPTRDEWGEDNGVVYLVSGPVALGIQSLGDATTTLIGASTYDAAGEEVAAAGDVDGDGVSDLLIASPASGQSYLLPGTMAAGQYVLGTSGRTFIDAEVGTGGPSIGAAGDIDGDGVDDVALGYLLQGVLVHGEAVECDADLDGYAGESDCDDHLGRARPGGYEYCDGVDNDCNGVVDDDVSGDGIWYQDLDGDGFGWALESTTLCTPPDGYVRTAGDCDDGAPDTYPGAPETCGDGLDQDCDGDGGCGLVGDAGSGYASAWFVDDIEDVMYARVLVPGDLDGDGFDDLAIADPTHWNGGTVGSVSLFRGPIRCGEHPISSADLQVLGDQVDADLGSSLAAPGDLDGDGLADLVMSGNRESEGLTGGVVHIVTRPEWTGRATVDSVATTVISFPTGISGPSIVSPAGDVDGNGNADLLVGDPSWQNDHGFSGGLFLFLGPLPAGALGPEDAHSWIVSGDDYSFLNGADNGVGSAGDFNGDGYGDIAVGVPYYAPGGSTTGRVFLFFGPMDPGEHLLDEADVVIFEASPGSQIGGWTEPASDLDGDGMDDLWTSALYAFGQKGAVRLFLGTDLPGTIDVSEAVFMLKGDPAEGSTTTIGTALSAGDFDGDGQTDLAVSADHFNGGGHSSAGRTWLLYGPFAEGTETWPTPYASFTGQDVNYVGNSLDLNGDLNGDGWSDLVLGTMNYGDPLAYIVFGRPRE